MQRGGSGDEFVRKELSAALKSRELPSFLLHYNSRCVNNLCNSKTVLKTEWRLIVAFELGS